MTDRPFTFSIRSDELLKIMSGNHPTAKADVFSRALSTAPGLLNQVEIKGGRQAFSFATKEARDDCWRVMFNMLGVRTAKKEMKKRDSE